MVEPMETPGMSQSARHAMRATINRLVAACTDAEHTYANAAERVHDDHLRKVCERRRDRRVQITNRLAESLRAIGERPIDRGSLTGVIELAAARLAHFIDGQHDRDILHACERVDIATADAYTRALGSPIPDGMRTTLTAQRAEIVADGASAHAWRLHL
jgi:uncharacterized protein (TIGR02284 family)